MRAYRNIILLSAIAFFATAASAQDYPYNLDQDGRVNFDKFLQAPGHKAFAVGAGTSYAWRSGQPTVEEAIGDAMSRCRQFSGTDCQLVQIDNQRVAPAYQAPPQSYQPPPPPAYAPQPQYDSTPALSHIQREALEDGCRLRYGAGNPHKYKECLELGANWRDALAQGCEARYADNGHKLRECMQY